MAIKVLPSSSDLQEKNITPEAIFYTDDSISLIICAKIDIPRDHLREFCKVSQENKVSLTTLVGPKISENLSLINIGTQKLLDEKISLAKIDEGANFITYAFPSRFEHKVLNDLHHILFS